MIGKHFSEETIIGYLYHTLTDARREEMDAHLSVCSRCRDLLAAHEVQQKQIDQELKQAIKRAAPEAPVPFAAIAPQLRRGVLRSARWERLVNGLTVATAVSGLILALFSLFPLVQLFWVWELHLAAIDPLPTVASICFGVVMVGQFERRPGISFSYLSASVLTLLLWSGTAVIGLQNILVLRDLFMWFVVLQGNTPQAALQMSPLIVLPAAILWIIVVIGGAEYHWRRIGQRESWRLFALTIVIQLLLLLLPRFLF
ncbi:MAG: zf-HC2 domain-containing protein [Anaerolineales bacterium]|nr:zf-HC2 domain-containing protein [Anaerolineales bacterium]